MAGQNPYGVAYAKGPTGAFSPLLSGKLGDELVGQRVAEFYEETYAGNVFTVANPSAVTTSAALATTYVGLCLSNPAANTKNLILLHAKASFVVEPAAILAVGLIAGYAAGGVTAHTTPVTTLANAKINGAAPVGLADSACTLVGTPYWANWLGAITTTTVDLPVRAYNGSIIIPPGGYVAIGTLAAGPASGFVGSFSWAEEAV